MGISEDTVLDDTDHESALVRGPDATRKVGAWTRHLMGREIEGDGALRGALHTRNEAQWPAFVRELFGELYGLGTKPIAEDERATGSEWISEVLDQAQQLPEWQELKARSEGDPWRCGVGTANTVAQIEGMLREALDELPAEDPQELEREAQEAADQADAAQDAADTTAPDAGQELAQEAADEAAQEARAAQRKANLAKDAAKAAAEWMRDDNGVAMRQALREAAQEAHEEIDEMEMAMAGLGHGDGAGALSAVNAPSEQVAEALRNNPKLKAIAMIAGRIRMSAKKQQATKSDFGREEICDVELGNDIQRLLPSELVMMADPDLEPLLMRKLVERQAMQYQLRGREKVERGPIVVLVDSSGSMNGIRNEWAMGVALAMLEVAAMQRRPFALCHFTGCIEAEYVVPDPRSLTLERLIEMVCFFANGGTNVGRALDGAGAILRRETALQGGDVLLISDGASGNFSANVEALFGEFEAGTYGIAIGSDWAECNKLPLVDYHQVDDQQIRAGAENIEGVLAL
jgi:uncharacterized protein with von Willebrand factor type A (vWA) domain